MGFNPFQPVNEFNIALNAEAQAMAVMMSRGRFRKSVLDIQTVNANETQQQPFALSSSIGTPGSSLTNESTVIVTQMEPGFNAIITGMFWDYDPGISGGGAPNQNNWVQGDGQLSFSLIIDGLHIAGYTNINTRLGSITNRDKVDRGVPILTGQRVEVVVTVYTGGVTTPIILDGSRIVAGIFGVKFPCA